MITTKAILDEDHNGYKMFKIYEVDENGDKAVEFDRKTGEKKVKKPLVSMGAKKALAVNRHLPDLSRFLNGGQ